MISWIIRWWCHLFNGNLVNGTAIGANFQPALNGSWTKIQRAGFDINYLTKVDVTVDALKNTRKDLLGAKCLLTAYWCICVWSVHQLLMQETVRNQG
jgi:hypothetical protein